MFYKKEGTEPNVEENIRFWTNVAKEQAIQKELCAILDFINQYGKDLSLREIAGIIEKSIEESEKRDHENFVKHIYFGGNEE